jgi:hypothetical protein
VSPALLVNYRSFAKKVVLPNHPDISEPSYLAYQEHTLEDSLSSVMVVQQSHSTGDWQGTNTNEEQFHRPRSIGHSSMATASTKSRRYITAPASRSPMTSTRYPRQGGNCQRIKRKVTRFTRFYKKLLTTELDSPKMGVSWRLDFLTRTQRRTINHYGRGSRAD